MHAAFRSARAEAPCVLLLIGLDEIGVAPRHMSSPPAVTLARLSLAGQLTAELDAAGSDRSISVLATSDAPWDVDPTLLTTGRIDQAVLVPPPDRNGRVAVLEALARDWGDGHVDLTLVADNTEGYTCAELARVCDVAVGLAVGGVVTMEAAGSACSIVEPRAQRWMAQARERCGPGGDWRCPDDLETFLRRRRLAPTPRATTIRGLAALEGHDLEGRSGHNGNGRNGNGRNGRSGDGNGAGVKPKLRFTPHALSNLRP